MQPNPMQPQVQRTRDITYDVGLRAFFQRVYSTMSTGLVITALVAFAVANTPALYEFFLGNPTMRLIVMLSPLAFIFFGFTPNRIMRMSVGQAAGLFYAFSALLGISMASIFLAYTGESIARVFFITSAMFAGMSIFGYTTKRDLSGMGSLMMMGAWGLLVAMIVGIFFQSNALQFAISVIGVIVYTGLVGWETHMLKQTYSAGSSHEANSKMAIVGALGLYMDFIMIFQFLMRLMGSSRS
jgi:FtsH-binding integral membrane protein